jgi:hypothetical protein
MDDVEAKQVAEPLLRSLRPTLRDVGIRASRKAFVVLNLDRAEATRGAVHLWPK